MRGKINDFKIVNVRSIHDSGNLNLPLISILVGKNGSGKSTFMRFLQLFSQSKTFNKRAPLLFYGEDVDFGSFDEAISNNSIHKYIGFGFNVDTYLRFANGKSKVNFFCKIQKNKEGRTYLSAIDMDINNNKISIEYENKKITKLTINNINFSEDASKFRIIPGFIIPEINPEAESSSRRLPWHIYRLYRDGLKGISQYISKKINYRGKSENLIDAIEKLQNPLSNEFIDDLKKILPTKKWVHYVESLVKNNNELNDVRSRFIYNSIPMLLNTLNEYLYGLSESIFYIGPIRYHAQRYYRIQELDVSRIDSMGKNAPAFINNLTSSEFSSFNSWVSEYFNFKTSKKSSEGHISIFIAQDDESEVNLADVGFGYSQVLPILIQFWNFRSTAQRLKDKKISRELSRLILIEQPELHLHPAFQKKLLRLILDTIIYCKDSGLILQVILETHSETIIDELGSIVLSDKFEKDDTAIYVFEKNNGVCHITASTFDENGFLTDWPLAFFQGSSNDY